MPTPDPSFPSVERRFPPVLLDYTGIPMPGSRVLKAVYGRLTGQKWRGLSTWPARTIPRRVRSLHAVAAPVRRLRSSDIAIAHPLFGFPKNVDRRRRPTLLSGPVASASAPFDPRR